MTQEQLKRSHYSTYNDLYSVWLARTVKDIADFEDVLSGFMEMTCWSRFDFDTTYTRDRMVSDWRSFLTGIIWVMHN